MCICNYIGLYINSSEEEMNKICNIDSEELRENNIHLRRCLYKIKRLVLSLILTLLFHIIINYKL